MEIPTLFKKSYCDQIVGNRNKEFGQYELRVSYPSRMHKAQLWVLFTMIGLVATLEWFSKPVEATKPIVPSGPVVFKEVIIDVFEMPKAKPKSKSSASSIQVPAAKADATKSNKAKPMEISKDVSDAPVDSSLLMPVVEGTPTGVEGNVGPGNSGTPDGKLIPGNGDEGNKGISEDDFGTNPIDVPEILPEFQGNLQSYFAKSTHYPNGAVQDEVEGQVFVLFIVDEKGKVTKPEILKGIRSDCDQEALRVVKAMPDWQPGKMDGKPVKVRMRIPVKFKLAK